MVSTATCPFCLASSIVVSRYKALVEAMITISIKDNFPDVIAKLMSLGSDIGNKAMVRSLNATVTQGKTEMARTISKEFRINVGTARERLEVSRASAKGGNLEFEVALSARTNKYRGLNLVRFVTGGTPRRTKKGMAQVKLQVKRAGGRKSIKGAFIATNRKTSGTALFIRTSNARYPIKTLTTIDIPQMFNTRRINEVVVKVMKEKFEANFDREMRKIVEGFVK